MHRGGHPSNVTITSTVLAFLVGGSGCVLSADAPFEETTQTAEMPVINGFNGASMPAQALIKVGGQNACSGVMLTNYWLVTAKHCVASYADSFFTVGEPGGVNSTFTTVNRVIRHPTLDVALMRLSTPWTINGSTSGYQRALYGGTAASMANVVVECSGYGYNTVYPNTLSGSGVLRRFTNYISANNLSIDSFEVPTNTITSQQLNHIDSGGGCFDVTVGQLMGIARALDQDPALAMPTKAYEVNVLAFSGWIDQMLHNELHADLSSPNYLSYGDGQADLFFTKSGTGSNPSSISTWLLQGTTYQSFTQLDIAPPQWTAVATGDFNRDGNVDIVWRYDGPTTSTLTHNEISIWKMAGANYVASIPKCTQQVTYNCLPQYTNGDWVLAKAGDIDGDGVSDLIWVENPSDPNTLLPHRVSIWFMEYDPETGYTSVSGTPIVQYNGQDVQVPDPSHWNLKAVADMNADGYADLVWRNTGTTGTGSAHQDHGKQSVWHMGGYTVQNYATVTGAAVDVSYDIVGAADVNADGHTDLIWQSAPTGANHCRTFSMWQMNDYTYQNNYWTMSAQLCDPTDSWKTYGP